MPEMTIEAAIIELNRLKTTERMDIDRERLTAAVRVVSSAAKYRIPQKPEESNCYLATLKTAVKTEIAAEWKKIQKEKALEMAQRCLKVYLYVLNRDYGFGKKRLTDFYNRCGEFMATADGNDVFWEQLDRSAPTIIEAEVSE